MLAYKRVSGTCPVPRLSSVSDRPLSRRLGTPNRSCALSAPSCAPVHRLSPGHFGKGWRRASLFAPVCLEEARRGMRGQEGGPPGCWRRHRPAPVTFAQGLCLGGVDSESGTDGGEGGCLNRGAQLAHSVTPAHRTDSRAPPPSSLADEQAGHRTRAV